MEVEQLFAMVFVVSMFAGVFLIFLAMRQRSHYLDMQHRERMAMIERGLTPGPSPVHRLVQARAGRGGSRSMTLGIVVIAVGLALMSIIAIAAATPDVGVGIGGAIMIVGAAFVVNSLVTRNMTVAVPDRPESPPPLPADRPE